jgi:putative phage-type endonuclease
MTIKMHAPTKFNNAELIGVFDSGSDDWHKARRNAVGGSEIGTILGLNPWESAVTLMAKKLDLIENPPIDNWAVKFGQKFEKPILELFQEEHPDFEIFETGTYKSATHPFMHANPDALAKVNGEWVIVEVKTSKNYWYEIPPAYLAQVRFYMAVMDVKMAVIVGVVNMGWVEHWIARDEFEESVIIQSASQFYKKMTEGELPDWDGAESTYQTVRELHPQITDEEVEIDGGHYLLEAQENFDKAQSELLEAKSRVMAAMGTAKHAYVEHEGQKFRIASRQARGLTAPYLIVNKKGK